MESPGSDTVGPDNRSNHGGIDGIRALMILGGGIGILLLVWFILTNVLFSDEGLSRETNYAD